LGERPAAHYPRVFDACVAVSQAVPQAAAGAGLPAILAAVLLAVALAWLAGACWRRRAPPPKADPLGEIKGDVATLAAAVGQLAELPDRVETLAVELRFLRAALESLVALQREEKTLYYTAPGGSKLHAVADCRSLARSAEIEELPLDANAAAFLYKVGAVCVRCAGPHPLAKGDDFVDDFADDE
jgi:hypothetical protein